MEARWKEVARSGPTRRSTACADRRSRSRSHTRHTVGAGAAVRVAVTPLLPSCPHRHPPAVGRRPDIASTQISKNHPAPRPWANFPGSGGRMAKTVTVQSEQSDIPQVNATAKPPHPPWQGSGGAGSSRSTPTAASAASARASPLDSSPRILPRPRAFAARAASVVPASANLSAFIAIAAASSRALRAGQSVRSRALKATHARIASSPHSA